MAQQMLEPMQSVSVNMETLSRLPTQRLEAEEAGRTQNGSVRHLTNEEQFFGNHEYVYNAETMDYKHVENLVNNYFNATNKRERDVVKGQLLGLNPTYEEFYNSYLVRLRKGNVRRLHGRNFPKYMIDDYLMIHDIIYRMDDFYHQIEEFTLKHYKNKARTYSKKARRKFSERRYFSLLFSPIKKLILPLSLAQLAMRRGFFEKERVIKNIVHDVHEVIYNRSRYLPLDEWHVMDRLPEANATQNGFSMHYTMKEIPQTARGGKTIRRIKRKKQTRKKVKRRNKTKK